jgi:hypothetical protein
MSRSEVDTAGRPKEQYCFGDYALDLEGGFRQAEHIRGNEAANLILSRIDYLVDWEMQRAVSFLLPRLLAVSHSW